MQDMTEVQQAAKVPIPKSPASIVSNRAYKKKDYDYITGFNLTIQSGRMTPKTNTDPRHHRFDRESDLLVTQSSLDSGMSPSFASSLSLASVESYTKTSIESLEAENQHHRSHYLVSSPDSLQMTEKWHGKLHVQVKDKDLGRYVHSEKNNTEGDDEVARGHAIEMTKKTQPTVLPKFGEWNSGNVLSGDGYTDIFKEVSDEKKSEFSPVSPLFTDPKLGISDSYSSENVEHEPEHPLKAQESKSLSSKPNKANSHSSQQHKSWKWIFCCTASPVVD